MTTDDTPIETSEADARPWKPSDGYLPSGGDDEHPAVKERSAADVMQMALEALDGAYTLSIGHAATYQFQHQLEQPHPTHQAILDKATAAIAALREAIERDGWMPIETAPKDGSYFIAGNKHGAWVSHHQPRAVSGYTFDNPWRSVMLNHWHIVEQHRYEPPTHWRPLPPAPKD